MRVKDKQKICSHCEGRISVEADTCLYCGMPLLEDRKEEQKPVDIMSSLQGGIPSLYPPLYAQKSETQEVGKQEFMHKIKPHYAAENTVEKESQEVDKSNFFSLLLALLGSNLFILGLMQGFFSEGGVLQLEWNCKYWFLYLLLAVPMLYMGIKNKKITPLK